MVANLSQDTIGVQKMDSQCEMSMKNESGNSEDEDTLEAEISRLEATLHELDNDFKFFQSEENLEDNKVHDTDSYEITEKTITNNDFDIDPAEDISEKTITDTNFLVPTCTEFAESDGPERQKLFASETLSLCKPFENETDACKEVLCSDQGKCAEVKESHGVSCDTSSTTGENEGSGSTSGSIVSIESPKTSDNNVTSSEFLSIHPTIDNELEALIKSPFTSSVQTVDSSLEFSPFKAFQKKWFTSSPKITNSKEHHQCESIFPSLHTEIQSKLMSLDSLPQHKGNERRQEQDFTASHLGISELQSSFQKPNKGSTIQQLVKEPIECKLESKSDKESSSDSVIILEEHNLKKGPSESFLDLDISQDFAKEWLTADEDGSCDSIIGPISSTPYRKGRFSLLTSKCSDFHHGGSFVVLDEVGEVTHADTYENKIVELPGTERNDAKDSNGSLKLVKSEPKSVELDDHQELNISLKQTALVEHPPETVTTDNDKVAKPEMPPVDKRDEEYVKTIEVIKSDYLFKSEDPEENADNFNPEWEVLRKLQTDEERYKAMRERWRNLIIPDPNLDLTHHTWRLKRNKSKTQPAKGSSETEFMFTKPQAESRHKRTLSDPSSSSEERSAKRTRTKSCTTLFDYKLQQLRQEIDSEQHRLFYEEAQAVQNLRHEQAMQKVQLRNYYHGYQFMSQMQSLDQEYLENEEKIRMQYKGARYLAESSQENKIHSLEKASAEVRAFHRFYQGLENKEENDTSAYLSESQLEELWETENFYEECEKFYTV